MMTDDMDRWIDSLVEPTATVSNISCRVHIDEHDDSDAGAKISDIVGDHATTVLSRGHHPETRW